MNKCSHCQNKNNSLKTFEYSKLALCDNCFKRLIESRVKKNIKTFGPLDKEDILYLKGETLNKKIAFYILSKIFDKRFISIKNRSLDNISFKSTSSKKQPSTDLMKNPKKQIICIVDSLEEITHKITTGIFKESKIQLCSQISSKTKDLRPFGKKQTKQKQIFLFCDVPYEELLIYSQIERINISKKITEKFNSNINSIIKKSIMFKSLNPSKKELFGLVSSFKKLNPLLE